MSDRCPTCGGRKATWTQQAILTAVHVWEKKHGDPPRANQWSAATPEHPASSTALRMFGSWNRMIAAAGFKPRARHRPPQSVEYTRAQVVQAIFQHTVSYGRLPRYDDWSVTEAGRPSAGQVVRLFGSWNAGIVAAGYEPRKKRRSLSGYSHQAGMRQRLLQGVET